MSLLNNGGTDLSSILPGLALPKNLYTLPTAQSSPLVGLVQKLLGSGSATPAMQPTAATVSPQQAVPGGIASQPQPTAGAVAPISPPPAVAPSDPGTESLVGRILAGILGPGSGTPAPSGDSSMGTALNGFAQKAAEAGIPPPPNAMTGTPPAGPAAVGGMPNVAAPTAPPPGPNITQFDLMSAMPKVASENAKPPTGTNTPKPAAPQAATTKAAPTKGEKVNRAASALAAVQPPPSPVGLNPSTPAAIQPRAIDLGAMNDIVAQVLARRQQTQLPELSAFLQRRPMA